jgi:hypothetical protein
MEREGLRPKDREFMKTAFPALAKELKKSEG